MTKQYDAIVVGARCAGAATAMLLARGGMKVLLADWAEPRSDTMSTHALMRGAVMQLSRWDLLDQVLASGAPVIDRTVFHYGDEAVPVDIRPAFGTPGLVAPRRYVLDAILVDAARRAGVDVRFGTAFRNVIRGKKGQVTGAWLDSRSGQRAVSAPLLIGADGRRSTVVRRVDAPVERTAQNSVACVYAYAQGLPNHGYEWFYAPGIGTGAIPTNDGMHCVFAAAKPDRLREEVARRGAAGALHALVQASNEGLARRLSGARGWTPPVVFGGAPGFLRQATGDGWALVGDAGYFKDPLTAHGITDAFRDAEILARAVLDGDADAYQPTRDALSAELFAITDRVASLDWSLDELKKLHVGLNGAMKAEQAWMAETFAAPASSTRAA
ncbi:NAD(P)/FAD-dependent oxidoreductase [Halovulum sp. GXIMD14794]